MITSYDLDRALAYYAQQIELSGLSQAARTAALSELESEVALRRAELEEARDLFSDRAELGEETRDYVYLAGEVSDQGRYALPYGRPATLADALYGSGGGFGTETGNPSQIYVLRTSTDPTIAEPVIAWHLDARDAATSLSRRSSKCDQTTSSSSRSSRSRGGTARSSSSSRPCSVPSPSDVTDALSGRGLGLQRSRIDAVPRRHQPPLPSPEPD